MHLTKFSLVLIISSLALGFTWGNTNDKSSEKSKTAKTQVSAPVKTKEPAKTVPQTNTRTEKPAVPAVNKLPVDPQIDKVSKEINDIVELNRTLKASNTAKYREIQRVIDQSRVYKQILDNIKTLPPANLETVEGQAEQTIRKEKLDLISEQTKKNRELIESFNEEEARPISSVQGKSSANEEERSSAIRYVVKKVD